MSDKSPASTSALRLKVGGAILWLILFLVAFFSFTLPNSNPKISRVEVLSRIHFLYLELIDPIPDENAPPSGWSYFPQRLNFLLIALGIHLAAWSAGGLILRLIRWDHESDILLWTVFASGIGLAVLSLITLGLGLAGLLSRELFIVILMSVIGGELYFRLKTRPPRKPKRKPTQRKKKKPAIPPSELPVTDNLARLKTICLLVMAPFLFTMLLGALLPSFDFDVKAYHLLGPKEFYQQGRITFLSHNVYTSFPFLTEMLSLLGMVLYGDWYWGALVGKAVLMGFAPLTALALLVAGRRLFGEVAGWLAATIHLTTPWIYRISIIAYAEGGLTFYLFASLLAFIVACGNRSDDQQIPNGLLVGLFAGNAMACKYTGILQVVFPMFVAVTVMAVLLQRKSPKPEIHWQPIAKIVGVFGLGVALMIGPWLLKNLVQTGNPVYPLMYTLFGGVDWNEELNAKWRAGHSPDHHELADLGVKLVDVTLKSDWLSPLLFGFAPLVFLKSCIRARARWLWFYVGFLFLSWWVLTHRIDRFWVPMIPVVSLLAGAGVTWSDNRYWKMAAGSVMAATVLFNLAFITTGLCGYNAYLIDLQAARRQAETTSAGIPAINRELPENAVVLSVGDGQVFDARCRVIYNTVFDESIFVDWFAARKPDQQAESWSLRPADEIRKKLKAEGVTHIYVNWVEIARYRNSYGFTKFVTPERFQQLQQMGIIGPAVSEDRRLLNESLPWYQIFPVNQ